MNILTLETLLSSDHIEVSRDGNTYTAGEDACLTLLLSAGGDVARLAKIEKVVIEGTLVVLYRDGAVTLINVDAVLGLEQDRSAKDKEKRRTGFV